MSKTTTPEQYEKLANLMTAKADIACGYHQRSKEEATAFWEEVTEVLNALGPPTKSAIAWKKVWIDWKCYIKKKLSANKREMMSTGGGPCRLQRISPLEEKVVHLTGLVTSTSGISGAVNVAVACEVEETEMDISARSEDLSSTSKRRQQSPKYTTLSLLKEQLKCQQEFYEEMKEFNNVISKKYYEIQRHNKIKEELLKKKVEIKLRMLQLEHPDER